MVYISGFVAGLLLGYLMRDDLAGMREAWEEVKRDGFNG